MDNFCQPLGPTFNGLLVRHAKEMGHQNLSAYSFDKPWFLFQATSSSLLYKQRKLYY